VYSRLAARKLAVTAVYGPQLPLVGATGAAHLLLPGSTGDRRLQGRRWFK
jgi:hypothetical protein